MEKLMNSGGKGKNTYDKVKNSYRNNGNNEEFKWKNVEQM